MSPVDQTPPGTVVRARTSTVFPGRRGPLSCALVIGAGGHVLAVRIMLRDITRHAQA